MLPLTTADLLTHAIVGSVLENLDMERLVREVGQAVSQRILGNNESVDDVARELHERLLLRNESTKKVVIESIYRESEEAKHNVSTYMQASSLAEARPHLKRVRLHHMSTALCVAEPMVFMSLGTRDPLHGQVPPREDVFLTKLLLQLSIPSSAPRGEGGVATEADAVVAPAQGRDRLQGVRRGADRERVRHCRPIDAVLASRREGGVRRGAE